MGRTSIFSFPKPGRRTRPSNEPKSKPEVPAVSQHASKAQKLLGTAGDLNIDSPTRSDNGSWRSFRTRPSSSGMSVAISDSTQEDNASIISNTGDGDRAVGGQLRGKASSTLLGSRYHDGITTDVSSIGRRLRTENSSSTLRSYYDRQSTPLSVSQQTSASSARDLALRKGFPPVASYNRSPLLEVDNIEPENSTFDWQNPEKAQNDSASKKKPSRLDLARLFPKPRKGNAPPLGKEQMAQSPSSTSLASTDTRRSDRDNAKKLTKEPRRKTSKDAMRSQDNPVAPSGRRLKDNRLSDVYEDRESLPNGSPRHTQASLGNKVEHSSRDRMRLPEQRITIPKTRDFDSPDSPIVDGLFPKGTFKSPGWETRSFTSTTSKNSKGSKHTSVSVMSNSDLRHNSVLSFSSSDEDSDGGPGESVTGSVKQSVQKPVYHAISKSALPPSSVVDRLPKESVAKASPPRRPPCTQDANYLTIPLPPLAGSRLSGPWNPRQGKNNRHSTSTNSTTSRRESTSTTPGSPVVPAFSSRPGSQDLQNGSGRDSRLMAVTKQEEALLEALRQKRARMKESIIAEHEHEIHEITNSLPSPPSHTSHPSPPSSHAFTTRSQPRDSASSVATVRPKKGHETVLLYLDTPSMAYSRDLDTAEPSPDLSDFLSFGSDEEDDGSTPRTSWIARKDPGRVDEFGKKGSPKTPQSAARLSAVGSLTGLVAGVRADGRKGVTFMEQVRRAEPDASPDYLDEINDEVWRL